MLRQHLVQLPLRQLAFLVLALQLTCLCSPQAHSVVECCHDVGDKFFPPIQEACVGGTTIVACCEDQECGPLCCECVSGCQTSFAEVVEIITKAPHGNVSRSSSLLPVEIGNSASRPLKETSTSTMIVPVTATTILLTMAFIIVAGLACFVKSRRAIKTEPRPPPIMVPGDGAGQNYIGVGEFCIDRNAELGRGQGGVVLGGRLNQKFHPVDIAIKSMTTTSDRYLETSSSEVRIMQELGTHPNIVQLFGLHRRPDSTRAQYIIMERCANGSLKDYLDQLRLKGKLVDESTIQIEWGNGAMAADVIMSVYKPWDLALWALQIANAMDYVHSKNIVHCDIAARNVLFFSRQLVKLTDFGMARRLEGDEARMTKGEKVPWQWCPPEILRTISSSCDEPTAFSKQSDIWAFGVTIYEIFSFGCEPYGGAVTPEQLLDQLGAGERLPDPEFALQLTGICKQMKECWNLDPMDRPSFADLKQRLQPLTVPVPPQKTVKGGYIQVA